MATIKTGEILFRDERGALWLAESFEHEETGEVTTQQTEVEPGPETKQ